MLDASPWEGLSMTLKTQMNAWFGWIIERSLDDQTIFDTVATVKMKSEQANWMERLVEIPEEKLGLVTDFLKEHLEPAWYAHAIKADQVRVIFKDKAFDAKEGESFEEIENYGVSAGTPKEEIDVKSLFDQARAAGL